MTNSTRTGPPGRIGVLESEAFLAPELQRQFVGEQTVVQSFRQVDGLVALKPPRVFVLTIEADQNAVIRFIQTARLNPAAPCVVPMPGADGPSGEWSLREIGAVSVVDPFIRGDELAAICRKLLNSQILREHRHQHHV